MKQSKGNRYQRRLRDRLIYAERVLRQGRIPHINKPLPGYVGLLLKYGVDTATVFIPTDDNDEARVARTRERWRQKYKEKREQVGRYESQDEVDMQGEKQVINLEKLRYLKGVKI